MLVAGFPAGPWGTNCWVVAVGAGAECLVIDPGKDVASGLSEVLRENRLRPVAVLLTHGHIDHMWSVTPVSADYGIPAYIHPADRERLTDPSLSRGATSQALLAASGGQLQFQEPAEVRELADGLVLELAGVALRVNHAPGHTQGSVAFTVDLPDEPLMFSGDLLFAGSVGRTDLAGGDPDAMLASLARVALSQPDNMTVCPGHGQTTTIGQERMSNPYLQQSTSGNSTRRGL
ncbi:MAG: MBL fold metallo-hydrolase [Actinomycetes bacterium]